MHWILQENLWNEAQYEGLIDFLERMSIPHSVHKVVPFIGELIPEPVVTEKNVIVFGSYSMRHTAKKNGWIPGCFDLEEVGGWEPYHQWKDLMLNFDSVTTDFASIDHEWLRFFPNDDDLFIRPLEDTKFFAGDVFPRRDMQEWVEKVVDLGEDDGSGLRATTPVIMSTPKKIYVENRHWVVDGEIVTSSQYKKGSRVIYDSNVDYGAIDFIKGCIDIWQPLRAFVIDSALTPDGYKIVEINTINSAGLYQADVQKLIMALEEMEFND